MFFNIQECVQEKFKEISMQKLKKLISVSLNRNQFFRIIFLAKIQHFKVKRCDKKYQKVVTELSINISVVLFIFV